MNILFIKKKEEFIAIYVNTTPLQVQSKSILTQLKKMFAGNKQTKKMNTIVKQRLWLSYHLHNYWKYCPKTLGLCVCFL